MVQSSEPAGGTSGDCTPDRRRRALVVANGDCDVEQLAATPRDASTLVVAVDGGLRHCRAAAIEPHWFVGDGDSAPASLSDAKPIRHLRFSPVKNASDLKLALDALADEAIDDVWLYGVSGGRTDHLLFNWLLPAQACWPFRLRLVDRTTDATVVRAGQPYREIQQAGRTFSVLALSPAKDVRIDGACYPLSNAGLMPGDTLGLSNVTEGGELSVRVRDGVVLVMLIDAVDRPEA